MKSILLLTLSMTLASVAMAAEKPPCGPYVWGGPTPFDCVTVTYPAPAGGTIDMADWMVMDATLRDRFIMQPGTLASHLVNNKIIYTKFDTIGDFADVWTFDADYIYFYATYGAISPGQSRGDKAHLTTDDPLLPRYAQLGMPGVRLVSEGGNWQGITDCELGPVVPSSNTITELWGPFDLPNTTELGDAMYYVSMRSYWDCHGTTTDSCTQEEDYWYMKPYGWIKWTAYQALNRDGNFIQNNGGTMWGPVAGSSALPDWCLHPSLFATDPTPHNKPISIWPEVIIQRQHE